MSGDLGVPNFEIERVINNSPNDDLESNLAGVFRS